MPLVSAGNAKWLGLTLEISYFRASTAGDIIKFDLIPISPLLMLRVPIVASPSYPGGRLQPYVGIGPALVLIDVNHYCRSAATILAAVVSSPIH